MKIIAKDLSKKYGDREVVSGVNLEVRPGQILALLGPNGAGKSTTIKMLTGQIAPSKGSIDIDGKEFTEVPKSFRGKIGVMPQEVVVWEAMTTLENIQMAATFQGLSGKNLKKAVDELVKGLNLEPEMKTLARNLSGGYKRRLNLAISIVHDPSVVFLDEPSPGIDPQNRRFLWEYIRTLKESGKAVVLTDHYLEEAEALADYIVIVDNGKVIAEGTNQDLKERYGSGSIVQLVLDETEKDVKEFVEWCEEEFEQVAVNELEMSFLSKKGVDSLEKVMKKAKTYDLVVRDITLKQPTLEDIFLLLTGHEIRH
jgi:ABC-2 type transport system ATP-binding protein